MLAHLSVCLSVCLVYLADREDKGTMKTAFRFHSSAVTEKQKRHVSSQSPRRENVFTHVQYAHICACVCLLSYVYNENWKLHYIPSSLMTNFSGGGKWSMEEVGKGG